MSEIEGKILNHASFCPSNCHYFGFELVRRVASPTKVGIAETGGEDSKSNLSHAQAITRFNRPVKSVPWFGGP